MKSCCGRQEVTRLLSKWSRLYAYYDFNRFPEETVQRCGLTVRCDEHGNLLFLDFSSFR